MFADLLRSKLAGIVELSVEQVRALESHYELLLRWNQVLNLTAIESMEEVVERHYCESLFLAAHLPVNALTVADIGSGAGFPGIPVAVFRPDCSVTLVESHRRKAVFLREATRKLPNIRVVPNRAEDLSEHFGCAISRAVSYEDLIPVLKNITQSAHLLTGADAPPQKMGFVWEEPIPLPWGRNRFLRRGVAES